MFRVTGSYKFTVNDEITVWGILWTSNSDRGTCGNAWWHHSTRRQNLWQYAVGKISSLLDQTLFHNAGSIAAKKVIMFL